MAVIGEAKLRAWRVDSDNRGIVTYKALFIIQTDSTRDGPSLVSRAPGLPLVGAVWNYRGDVDPTVFCTSRFRCYPHPKLKEKPGKVWFVEKFFKTPDSTAGEEDEEETCVDFQVDNPLLKPPRISGSFVSQLRKTAFDKDDNQILTSSKEEILLDIDTYYPTVRIEQNVPTMDLDQLTRAMYKLNEKPMWGLEAEEARLIRASWRKKYYGACFAYYNRVLEFDINFLKFREFRTDKGTRVLAGRWVNDASTGKWSWELYTNFDGSDLDPNNPANYIQATDLDGNPIQELLLDGEGKPRLTNDNVLVKVGENFHIQLYAQFDFFNFGLPSSL